jgi:hypothetical protein
MRNSRRGPVTEQATEAVMIEVLILEVLGWNLGRDVFSSASEVVPLLGQYCFLRSRF